MRAIVCDGVGAPDVMAWSKVPDPVVGDGDILIRVAATALNRADLAQREGRYPVPAGASPILGMECAGLVENVGAGVSGFAPGDRVMALLTGGGYAELVNVPAGQVVAVPEHLTLGEAAGLPEVLCTVYSNLVVDGRLAEGQTVLVHGGGSGIGTMSIQVARALGAVPIVTVGSASKAEQCLALGAEAAIQYKEEDFAASVHRLTGGRGVDVLLDCVGGPYLERNLAAVKDDGIVLVIGLQGGAEAPSFNLQPLMRRRLTLRGSTLRARSDDDKARIVRGAVETLMPFVTDGTIRPLIDTIFDVREVARAHEYLHAGTNVGKVVLTVDAQAAAQ